MSAHINGRFGKAIYACKKRFYEKLKAGADVTTAVSEFLRDLENALREIVKNVSP